jgi:hypothetical protein
VVSPKHLILVSLELFDLFHNFLFTSLLHYKKLFDFTKHKMKLLLAEKKKNQGLSLSRWHWCSLYIYNCLRCTFLNNFYDFIFSHCLRYD